MRILSPEKYNDRYIKNAPMPNMIEAVKDATDALDGAQYCLDCVIEECCEAIAYSFDYCDKYKKGELEGWSDVDIANLKGESKLAQRILKVLGYEIDYYFCSWPKLKPIEGDTQ